MPKDKESELIHTRVSSEAKALIASKAEEAALTESAYVRRLIYKSLGLIKKGA